ncbi:MAG: hypothetical protein U9N33_03945 [Campylobacterota bacterium]|nr:hypothetical protein [Campylobacterota bacterium]
MKFQEKTRDKIDGYEKIFNEKKIIQDDINFKVELYIYNINTTNDALIDKYVEFEFDEIFKNQLIQKF